MVFLDRFPALAQAVPRDPLEAQMTALSYPPVELDPAYVAPAEPIEDAILPRRPEVGGWINGAPERGGPMVLARVLEVREGDYSTGGVVAEPWDRRRQGFDAAVFVPWERVNSRAVVNSYSLTC